MKRILYSILLVFAPIIAIAEGFDKEQMKLRMEIVQFLSHEGIKSTIDRDGDVTFEIDDLKYFFIIREKLTGPNPFLISLYQGRHYNDVYTKENMLKCINLVNQLNVVKLICEESSYGYIGSIFCKDINVVKTSFRPLLNQYRQAQSLVEFVFNSDLKGVDLINNKGQVLDYALELYAQENYDDYVTILKYLVATGYEQAYGFLGLSYETGNGVEKNEAKMIEMYNKAVKAGYNWCAYHLGQHYERTQNYDQALKSYIQCSSNDGTFRSYAFYAIGNIYENGLGVESSIPDAVKYYLKSVQYSKVLESKARLALIRLGKEIEPIESFIPVEESKIKGLSAADIYNIGLDYESGRNNRYVSLSDAYSYFCVAAQKKYPKALIKMGEIYTSKYYPFNDSEKSYKYYQRASKILKQVIMEKGDAEACYDLGEMIYHGKGGEKDIDLANELFKMGASKGHPEACYKTGLLCLSELDYPEAYKYFRRAADSDVGLAMFELAKLYESGLGVRYDLDEAIQWYTKCASTYCEKRTEAKEALDRLKNSDGKY